MTLREKQSKFTIMIAMLILFAEESGYELTFGDAYRDPRVLYGHKNSLHRYRLAVDLNLFKDGKWLTTDEDHAFLHDCWDTMGGAERIKGDGNHYALSHHGMK